MILGGLRREGQRKTQWLIPSLKAKEEVILANNMKESYLEAAAGTIGPTVEPPESSLER